LSKVKLVVSEYNLAWSVGVLHTPVLLITGKPGNWITNTYEIRFTRYELGITEKGNSYTINLIFIGWRFGG